MLKGKYVHNGHTVYLSGYDIFNTFYLRLSAKGSNREYFDGGYVIAPGDVEPSDWGYEGLYVSVGTSNIKVETSHIIDPDTGSKIKTELNREALTDLGSVLRGMKSQCIPVNRDDFHESGYGTDNYVGSAEHSYTVTGGTVTLVQGTVTDLRFDSGSGVELILSEDDEFNASAITMPDDTVSYRLDLSWCEPEQIVTPVYIGDEFYNLDQIITNNPKKSFSWLKNQNYHIVGPDNFKEVCRKLYKHDGVLAFDTETTGLNITFRSSEGIGDTLVGMVFSISEGESYYFPVAMNSMPNIAEPSEIDYVIEAYFKPILEKKQLVGHNISFDWKVMHIYGINCNFVFDTLTATRLSLWNDDTSFPLSLKGASQRILGRDSLELDDFVPSGKWNDDYSFADLGYEETKLYACADGDNTLALYNFFMENDILRKYGAEKVNQIEVLFSHAIGYSEYYGMYADPESVDKLESELQEQRDILLKELYELAGGEFNPNSPKQLISIIYDKLGVPVSKLTASGNPSTDKAHLKALAGTVTESGEPKYPFVAKLLEYRKVNQLLTTFIGPFHKESNDGFFHASVRQFLETGRVSISGPNYQSFNDPVKKYIVPRTGFYMFDSDFSSIEYRVLVSIAGETSLIEQFYDPDFDYHRRMAALLHGVPYEKVTPALRSQSKGLNFGIPYGMSIKGLASRMFGEDDPAANTKAGTLYHKYFDVQPKVREFFDREKDLATSQWFNSTFFGRRRYYNKNLNRADRIRRQAGNHPIQGTAADLYKMGIGRLFTAISERGLLGKILISAFVHDEVVIEAHNSINPAELLSLVRECLMVEIEGWCPLYIGAGFGMSWLDAKKTELPVQVQDDIVSSGKIDWWVGDGAGLVDWENSIIDEYKVKRINEYLANPENHDKPMAVAELGFVDDLTKGVEGDVNAKLLWLSEQGTVSSDLVHDANIIVEEDEPVEVDYTSRINPESITFTEDNSPELHTGRAGLTGVSVDEANSIIYVKWSSINSAWNKTVLRLVDEFEGDYSLVVVDDGELKQTSKKVSARLSIELLRLKGLARV